MVESSGSVSLHGQFSDCPASDFGYCCDNSGLRLISDRGWTMTSMKGSNIFKSVRQSEKVGTTRTVADRIKLSPRPAPAGSKICAPRKLSDGMGAKK